MKSNQKEKKKYYAIYGVNGIGIYNNYYLAQNEKEYLYKFKLQSFDNIEKAKIFAFDGYNEYQQKNEIAYQMLNEDWQMNWTYFTRDLSKMKMLESI